MSATRRSRKIIPVDPEQQPHIRKFITECTKVGLLPDKTKGTHTKVPGQKRRRSTGDKNKVHKKPPIEKEPNNSVQEEVLEMLKTDSVYPAQHKMSSSVSKESSDMPDSNNMLEVIKQMELQLTANIKETKEKELQSIETRLSELINKSINESVEKLHASVSNAVQNNPIVQTHS